MPKTGSNIYKRKDGRWEGRYQKGRAENGKIVYGYIYAKTCAEVKKRLREVPTSVLKPVTQTGSVSEMAKQWLSVMALKVKQSTLADYEANDTGKIVQCHNAILQNLYCMAVWH